MVFVGIIWLYFTGHILGHKELLIAFVFFFLTGIGGGYGLVKLGVPQKGNNLGNNLNPQIVDILERLERIEEKL